MIKVPATPEGIPAIRALTATGVSVNVTLIFSLLQYEEVVEAYLAGLEDRVAAGGSLDGLASVASFFVSRVDSACDKLLKDKAAAAPELAARCEALLGKLAIANAKMAYEIYERTIASPRWTQAGRGRRAPAAPAVGVDRHQGPALPRHLLRRCADGRRHRRHGSARDAGRLPRSRQAGGAAATTTSTGAKAAVAEFAAVGLDLSRVCHGLLDDGVKSFITSMKTLLDAIGGRRAALLESASGRQRLSLPERAADARPTPRSRSSRRTARSRRMWEADPTFFSADAVARALDQEPPRLAARARADADQAGRARRRSPPT